MFKFEATMKIMEFWSYLTEIEVHKEIVFSIEGVEKFFLRETIEIFEVQLISKTKARRIWNLNRKNMKVEKVHFATMGSDL
jgi:hypothetical protein